MAGLFKALFVVAAIAGVGFAAAVAVMDLPAPTRVLEAPADLGDAAR